MELIRYALVAVVACVLVPVVACPVQREEPPPGDDDDDGGDDDDECGCEVIPFLAIDPTVQDFGAVRIGEVGTPSTFTVVNAGDAGSQSGVLAVRTTGAFAIAENFCTTSLAAGESCTFTIAFAPTAEGVHTGTVSVSAASSDGTVSAALSGTGVSAPSPILTPSSASFGDVPAGEASAPRTFTLTNDGDAELIALTFAVGGANASQFVVTDDACAGTTLGSGARCEIVVEFRPTSEGAKVATLTVDSGDAIAPNAPNATTAALTGTGLSDGGVLLAMSPTSRNFGTVPFGVDSAELSFTITNVGESATEAIEPSIGGGDASQFFVTSSTCTAALAGGESCEVGVTFSPTAFGPLEASLDAGAASAALLGTGAGDGGSSIDPTSVDFGPVALGASSEPASFTLTNSGGSVSGALATSVGGVDAAMFIIDSDTCAGAALATGASCVVEIRFAPTAAGDRSATLSITDAASGDFLVAALAGAGI